jgi:PHP family Zn ribbon phosphoesterase
MDEITCPNCNVDADREELRRNNLRCPTCGHDLSDTEEADDPLEDEWEDEDEEDEDEEEEEEEEEEEQ